MYDVDLKLIIKMWTPSVVFTKYVDFVHKSVHQLDKTINSFTFSQKICDVARTRKRAGHTLDTVISMLDIARRSAILILLNKKSFYLGTSTVVQHPDPQVVEARLASGPT